MYLIYSFFLSGNDIAGSIAKTSTINIDPHMDSSENEHVQNYDRPNLLTTGQPVVLPPTQQDDACNDLKFEIFIFSAVMVWSYLYNL